MRSVKLTLGIGLILGAAAIGITLFEAPLTVARVNTAKRSLLGATEEKIDACQSHEVLPRGTSAIRLHVYASLGPRVTVAVLEQGRVIAHGEQRSGWTGYVVTVPVKPLSSARRGVTLCFVLFLNGNETAAPMGETTTLARAANGYQTTLTGRVAVEYLRPARSSWWSLALPVARRMGLDRAWNGAWGALVVIVLMGGLVLLCSRLVLRELR
jgi:hypothetical protein